MANQYIAHFTKDHRSRLALTQEELAQRAGVGLRFIRELEQGKSTLRLDKVNQVLALFGYSLTPGRELDPYDIHRNHFNRNVRVFLKDKSVAYGFIIDEVRVGNEISGWKFVTNNNAIAYQSGKNPDVKKIIPHRDIERIENI